MTISSLTALRSAAATPRWGDIVSGLYREGGPRAFYRGVTPPLLVNTAKRGVQMSIWERLVPLCGGSHALAGAAAGVLSLPTLNDSRVRSVIIDLDDSVFGGQPPQRKEKDIREDAQRLLFDFDDEEPSQRMAAEDALADKRYRAFKDKTQRFDDRVVAMRGAQRDFVQVLGAERQEKRDGALARARHLQLPAVSTAGDKARAVVASVCGEMLQQRSASAAPSAVSSSSPAVGRTLHQSPTTSNSTAPSSGTTTPAATAGSLSSSSQSLNSWVLSTS